MTVQVRAPVRVDFAGGWSDVPVFSDEFGGAVVNAAINQYVSVEMKPHVERIELFAEGLNQSFVCNDPSDLVYDGMLDLHKAVVRMFPFRGGITIKSSSSVPPGSGLGTSGALDVALVAGLSRLQGEDTDDKARLAEIAFRLEAVELGLLGGRQDQYAAAFGGMLSLQFSRDNVLVNRLDLDARFAAELERAMVIAYTGQTHFSSETHERVWSAFRDGVSHVKDALHVLSELATPTARALEDGDLRALADLIDENWSQQQRLHPSIATAATGSVEDAARRAGAWGAKATGAGAGGCMIFVGDPQAREHITNAVTRVGGSVMEYQFDSRGVTVT